MPKATHSLHQASEPFKPISRSAICILARQEAKKAVVAKLRDEGRRVSLIKVATITALTNEYVANHPELFVEAHAKAQRWGMYEKPPSSRCPSSRKRHIGH